MSYTYKDIARMAGVSLTTVSRVVNRKELHKVSKKKQDRIKRIIERLNFTPNIIARSLARKRTFNVAVGIRKLDDIINPYFDHIISGLGTVLEKEGYHLQLTNVISPDSACSIPPYLLTMREKRADGLCLISQEAKDKDIISLYKQKLPIVLIDKYIPTQKIPTILINNKEGMYLITKELIRLGHRGIAFMTGIQDLPYSRDRLLGYKKALKEAGIPFREEIVVEGTFNFRKDYETTGHLLDVKPNITALLTSDDAMAIAAMRKISERGLSIPEDISVVGFNDLFSHLSYPTLSSVRLPLIEIGKLAGRMLLELINKRRLIEKTVTFVPELVCRQSTGPCR